MDVATAAKELNVSPRRVRSLIAAGRITATKAHGVWDITATRPPLSQRPLSPAGQHALAHALHTDSLSPLTGQMRARTARRLRELRTSPNPAGLLAAWWGGVAPQGFDKGSNLVQHSIAGNNAHVAATIRAHRSEYLRRPADLADVIRTERTIRGMSRVELAAASHVSEADVIGIERMRPLRSPGPARRILTALDVEPLALPNLEIA